MDKEINVHMGCLVDVALWSLYDKKEDKSHSQAWQAED
jgi:hypothetical protein